MIKEIYLFKEIVFNAKRAIFKLINILEIAISFATDSI
jgi:hypothetical protein